MNQPFPPAAATAAGSPPAPRARFTGARHRAVRHGAVFFLLLSLIAVNLTAATTVFATAAPAAVAPWPNADAVNEIIDKHYVVADSGGWVLRCRVVCRIRSYKGKKDHADFKINYNGAWQRVRVDTARTITAAGGEIPVDPAEINDIPAPWTTTANIYAGARQRVINFPAVEPGCTVAVEFTLISDRGFWATELFALPDPIARKTVSIDLPADLPLALVEPPGVSRREQRSAHRRVVVWTTTDRPAEIPEPLLPAPENRGAGLQVSTFGTWRQTTAWFTALLPPATVTAATAAAVIDPTGTGTPADHGDTRKAAASVDRLYLELMARTAPRPIDLLDSNLTVQTPAETRVNGYGTPLDLALLFGAELAARGLEGELLLANHRDLVIDPLAAAHSPSCFTVPLVRCAGSFYAFHQRDLAPGDTGLAGRRALRLADGELLTVSDRHGGRHEEILTLAPTGDNRLGGTWQACFSGSPATDRRAEWRFQSPPEWRRTSARLLHDIDPQARTVTGTPVTVSGLTELNQPLEVSCRFSIPRGFEPLGGGRLTVPLPELPLPDELRSLPAHRRGPLLLAEPLEITLTTVITMPPELHVVRQPRDETRTAPGISTSRKTRQENDTLTVSRRVVLERTLLPAPGHGENGGDELSAVAAFRRALIELLRPENRLLVLAPAGR
ncbi:MAG: DUF3857 domain-containing protein [Deltaproteobacteria bacterium]|nr:DUF3857 domain-containing protein [Candidatus Anaeroferrophillacea bacterium]